MSKHPAWAEIDLSALAHNCREVRRIIGPGPRFMATVKAEGYGHGARAAAETALANGADSLAVARLQEALDLRGQGLTAPILVFGYVDPGDVPRLLRHNLTATVYSLQSARALSRESCSIGAALPVHLKIDTGMGRLGLVAVPRNNLEAFDPSVRDQVVEVCSLPGLRIEGAYTHFAQADAADKTHARSQLQCFTSLLEDLGRRGIAFPLRHAANSAAVMDLPEAHLDLVRPGLMLYGLYPSQNRTDSRARLRQAMTLKTRIVQVKRVASGFKISYGSTFETTEPTTIATVSLGYADGYSRLLSSRGHMIVRGVRVPVVGRVCMDQTMIDVGGVPSVAPGEEVAAFGSLGGAFVSAEEVASLCSTINYETVATVLSRVPRVYRSGS
jgi:alanine racemase